MAKRAVLEHPKFANLQAILGLPKYAVLGLLETLWQFTGRYAPQGDIGRFSDAEVEAWLGWGGEPGALLSALVESRWVDPCGVHRLLVHDWADHLDETTKKQLRRSNLSVIEGPKAGHVPDMSAKKEQEQPELHQTSGHVPDMSGQNDQKPPKPLPVSCLPEPEPEPEPEPDTPLPPAQRPDMSGAPPGRAEPGWDGQAAMLADQVLAEYPPGDEAHKRPALIGACRSALASGVSPPDVLSGVRRYARYCLAKGDVVGTRFVKAPHRFVAERHFLDDWAPPPSTQRPRQKTRPTTQQIVEKALQLEEESCSKP